MDVNLTQSLTTMGTAWWSREAWVQRNMTLLNGLHCSGCVPENHGNRGQNRELTGERLNKRRLSKGVGASANITGVGLGVQSRGSIMTWIPSCPEDGSLGGGVQAGVKGKLAKVHQDVKLLDYILK